MRISVQKLAYALLFIVLATIILIYADTILKPFAFALIASTIYLKPADWIESKGVSRPWAAAAVMLSGTVLFLSFSFFISREVVTVMTTLESELNLDEPSEAIAQGINGFLSVDWIKLSKKEVSDSIQKWLGDVGVPFISNAFKSTGYLASSALLSMIYTFFILIYRKGIARVFQNMGAVSDSSQRFRLLKKMVETGRKYIGGLGILMLILSVLYSITFTLFGIDYAFVFAIVAAALAIIPYIGTTLGASLPVIYAYLTYDNHFVALGLIACIIFIQTLEGNFLTPRIVGGNMKLNPLISLLAVVVGNFIWGLAGMVLFLPFVAMLKIYFEEIDTLKPLAKLSGQNLIEPNQANE